MAGIILTCFISSCASLSTSDKSGKEGIAQDTAVAINTDIIGKTTWNEWDKFAGGRNYSYEPDETVLPQIGRLINQEDYKFLLFAGKWCSDSRNEVPKMFKVMHKLGVTENEIGFYGLNRDMEDGDGIARNYGIKRVPTLIVFLNDKEIGRIVEYPAKTIEKDILNFLTEN